MVINKCFFLNQLVNSIKQLGINQKLQRIGISTRHLESTKKHRELEFQLDTWDQTKSTENFKKHKTLGIKQKIQRISKKQASKLKLKI